jgi:hypothetical protein
MESPKEAETLCEQHLTVVPLVDPLRTIRSRFTRGYDDWQAQVRSWEYLLLTQRAGPFYLPVDLLGGESFKKRRSALKGMASHLGFTPDSVTLLRWSRDWPEHRSHEARDQAVPNLSPMIYALRQVEGLREFLQGQGYNLEWIQ